MSKAAGIGTSKHSWTRHSCTNCLLPSANNNKRSKYFESVFWHKKSNSGCTRVFIGFGFLHLLESLGKPRLLIYKYTQNLPALIQDWTFPSITGSSSNRGSAPMETCTVARIMGLKILAIHPTNLCSLVLRLLPKLLGLSPSSLKKFWKHEHAHPPLVQTTVGTTPELPQDILMDIFATLEIPDLVRAGSVCQSWRFAYTSLRSLGQYKQSQTPCLFYTSESDGESVAWLYSLLEKRSYKLTLPQPPIRRRYLIGSSHGWLVTVDERSEMHLVNPITCEQIALPSVITIEQVKPIFDEYGVVHKYEFSSYTGTREGYDPPRIVALGELRDTLHYKAFVFLDASTGSYIVVLIHHPLFQLSFARVGDDKWTWLPPHAFYKDCLYNDGLLYAATSLGEIHAFDLSGPVITMKMLIRITEQYENGCIYIVQAPWGGLLLVWRIFEDYYIDEKPGASDYWNTTEIKIYEVDAPEHRFWEIDCPRGHALFLGHNQSLCLSAKKYLAVKANHSYFTDDNWLWTLSYKNKHRDIGILNLDDNTREEPVSPQLWSDCPAPMWITPDLRKMNFA